MSKVQTNLFGGGEEEEAVSEVARALGRRVEVEGGAGVEEEEVGVGRGGERARGGCEWTGLEAVEGAVELVVGGGA